MPERIVIIGGGQAAVSAIDTLRRRGYSGHIALVGEEPVLPYQRPPLSKKYLAGELEPERLTIRPAAFYVQHAVELHIGSRASAIERTRKQVRLEDGRELPYDALLLATGSRARRLALPGAELAGVHYLRSKADVDAMRPELTPGRHLAVIGGGYIGLEVASTARERGLDVTVYEVASRLMSRVTCDAVAGFYQGEHERHGVHVRCSTRLVALHPGTDGRVGAVETHESGTQPADLVVIGIGVLPADELAAAAGLECANGIRVDAHCRTSDPDIYAAGDCTQHPSARYGCRLRLESVDNAFEQGASAALNMLGIDAPHDKVPWFWSDQYDLKLIIVGISTGHDMVILRGAPAQRSFSACYLRQGELIALDTINAPKDQMAARRLVAQRVRPDLLRLADPAVPLKDLG